jgi:hypothetical protein
VLPATPNIRTKFFTRKLEALTNWQGIKVKSSKSNNEKATEPSYRLSYRSALVGEAHTVAEILIKPCALEKITCVFGEQSKNKLETIQLSNNTVKSRVQDLSVDMEKHLVSRLKNQALLYRWNFTNQHARQS